MWLYFFLLPWQQQKQKCEMVILCKWPTWKTVQSFIFFSSTKIIDFSLNMQILVAMKSNLCLVFFMFYFTINSPCHITSILVYVSLQILKRIVSLIYFPSCSWFKQGFNASDLFLSYKYTLWVFWDLYKNLEFRHGVLHCFFS